MNLKHTLIRKSINELVDKLETINKNARLIEEVEELASKLNDILPGTFEPSAVVNGYEFEISTFLLTNRVNALQLQEVLFRGNVAFSVKKSKGFCSDIVEFHIEQYSSPIRILLRADEFDLAS